MEECLNLPIGWLDYGIGCFLNVCRFLQWIIAGFWIDNQLNSCWKLKWTAKKCLNQNFRNVRIFWIVFHRIKFLQWKIAGFIIDNQLFSFVFFQVVANFVLFLQWLLRRFVLPVLREFTFLFYSKKKSNKRKCRPF